MLKRLLPLVVLFGIVQSQYSANIRYVRYYASDKDFIADNRLMATGRLGQPHLQVFFNDRKLPVMKEWVSEKGDTEQREILEYDKQKRLFRHYFLDGGLNPVKVIQYGEGEPWSVEFRKVISIPGQNLNYAGQRSKFSVDEEIRIQSVEFRTIDGFVYGIIEFFYDHLGMLIGENWRTLPNNRTVRKFAYDYDLIAGRRELIEYGSFGEELSHVVLTPAPADALYKYPPPRTGNRLDEVAIILEDIQGKDVHIPFDVFIPRTNYDIMVLTSGERLEIEFISIENRRVRFRMAATVEELLMPLERVNSIVNRFGEELYP